MTLVDGRKSAEDSKTFAVPAYLRADDGRIFHIRSWSVDIKVDSLTIVTAEMSIQLPDDWRKDNGESRSD